MSTFELRILFENLNELKDYEYKEKLSFLFEDEPIFKNRLKSLLNDLHDDLIVWGDMPVSLGVTIYRTSNECWFNFILDSCYPFFDNEIHFALSTEPYVNPLPTAIDEAILFDGDSQENENGSPYTDYVSEQDIVKTQKALINLDVVSTLLGINDKVKETIFKYKLGYHNRFTVGSYILTCYLNKSYSFSLVNKSIQLNIEIDSGGMIGFYHHLGFNLDFTNEDFGDTFETLNNMFKLIIKQYHKEPFVDNVENYLLLKEMESI